MGHAVQEVEDFVEAAGLLLLAVLQLVQQDQSPDGKGEEDEENKGDQEFFHDRAPERVRSDGQPDEKEW